jgi:hypothetical protein
MRRQGAALAAWAGHGEFNAQTAIAGPARSPSRAAAAAAMGSVLGIATPLRFVARFLTNCVSTIHRIRYEEEEGRKEEES